MCGICGIYNFKNDKKVIRERLIDMTNTMRHRGPDDEGFYIDGQIGFGFRRLSIIDLSGGHQPMFDDEKLISVIFNGEIYNYRELRIELEEYGHVFKTNSDTETIIYGYKQWGKEVFNHLNGMFAICIWDKQKKRFLLARDRMGIKLVYYSLGKGKIVFGSEIKAILAEKHLIPNIDQIALNLFLKYRYTPSPYTIYKGIFKLAPGSMLQIQNGHAEFVRWFRKKPMPFASRPKPAEAEEELLSLYRNAIKRQLVSDVPVGLMLSGGIDSSLILALMKETNSDWDTFTVGYGSSYKDDELIDARETAKILNVRNFQVFINHNIFEDTLGLITHHLEEPIASSSIVPMFHLSKFASNRVKVALIGQGPDEMFGGYRRHLGIRYGKYWRMLPRYIREGLALKFQNKIANETIRRGLNSLGKENRYDRYLNALSIFNQEEINRLFISPPAQEELEKYESTCWSQYIEDIEHTDELGGFQFLEIRSTLPDELLMYADKLSMAHGLELRIPYLDQDIVEYAERLPDSYKIRLGVRKWLHKKVCQGYLPQNLINRKKRGFGVNVVDDWFKQSLGKRFNDILYSQDSLMYRYLDRDKIQKMFEMHRSGKKDYHKILFSIICFEECMRANNIQ